MQPAVSEVAAAIGFLLTLVGLLGSFFAIHLSNWFRELLELKAKYEQHRASEAPKSIDAVTEVRYQLRRLSNHVPLLVAIVISAFIALVASIAFPLADGHPGTILDVYRRALCAFLLFYGILTVYFLIAGYWVALSLRRALK